MAPLVPYPWFHVIQPLRHASAQENASITYGCFVNSGAYDIAIDACQDAFNTNLRTAMDSEVTILPPVGYGYTQTGELLQFTASGPSVVGLSASAKLPSNNAVIIRKRTSFAGKKYRGRFYMPWWIQESDVSEVGVIPSTPLGLRQGYVDGFLDDLDAISGGGMWLFHDEALGLAPTRVTSLEVGPIIGTQRRRLGRV